MNEVEQYLRESGQWKVPVTTDWLGRATQGDMWHPTYFAQWLDAHPDHQHLKAGGWCPDGRGHEHWVTDTPDWDRQWFRDQGVRPPKRFGDQARTYWKDYGDGLSGLSYR